MLLAEDECIPVAVFLHKLVHLVPRLDQALFDGTPNVETRRAVLEVALQAVASLAFHLLLLFAIDTDQ